MFEKAIRGKYRFPYKGLVTIEDLWDLSVEELDKIYKTLNTEKKKESEESLLYTGTGSGDVVLNDKIDILKYIVQVKLDEARERELAIVKKAKKDKIMDILARKEDAALEGMTTEELRSMLDEM